MQDFWRSVYNINGTFLDYQHLVHNIHPTWLIQINDNHVFILENKTNVICNIYIKNLIKANKGSRIFYDTFVGVNEYIPQGKWQAEIGNISENEWKLYFLNLKQWHEVKIRDFQYKVNNKILVTNSFIAKINKIDSELCTYCKEQPEKIHHLFLTCPKVRMFWQKLRTLLYTSSVLRTLLYTC